MNGTDGPPPRRSTTTGDKVVIIGGGATGALIAVNLAEAGYQVTVCEKASIGNGSSSRSAACARAQFGTPETVIGMRYAEDWYVNFATKLQTSENGTGRVFVQNGYLFMYEDPSSSDCPDPADAAMSWQDAPERVRMQQSYDLPVELLNAAQVRERWPFIDQGNIIGATWCPTDGFLRHDLIYQHGFERARELGVTILQNTEVVGARLERSHIVALQTTQGEIPCDWVINATNAWANRLSGKIGGMELPVEPLKRFLYFLDRQRKENLMTEEAWRQLPMIIYGMCSARGSYSRPDGALLMMGWAHRADSEPHFTDEDQDHVPPQFGCTGEYAERLHLELAHFAPDLVDPGRVTRVTSGYYGTTPDHNPIIGLDAQLGNLVHAVGFSGHGLMHAPYTAFLVGRLLSGDTCVNGKPHTVRLPAPFDEHLVDISHFDPCREFSHGETQVI